MALWIILGIIVLLVIWIIGMYNGLVKAKIKVDNSWSDIRVFLKKRFDLIPNLVNTVKGYATHESQTFEKVTQARNAAVSVPQNFQLSRQQLPLQELQEMDAIPVLILIKLHLT